MSTKLEKNWQKFFRSGFYQEGWSLRIDPQKTQAEVEGVLNLLQPPPGSHILDWCGGWGRHSIELARRGFKVTLLDFAPNHVAQAEEAAIKAGVNLTTICTDFRLTPSFIQADYAVNLFTAGLGYLTKEDDLTALRTLYAALKPGAKFLVDTMNLFWLVRNYNPTGWHESEDKTLRVLDKRQFDFLTNRNFSETTYIREGYPEETQTLDHYIYTAAELAEVLKQAGFQPVELYGDFDGQPFGFDSRRILMISQKNG